MKWDFHPEARLEYREAAAFYEVCRPGLGASFSSEVETTVERILATPNRWRCVAQTVRQCRTRTFPYAVLYTVDPDQILILAVMHLHRRPGYWRTRLAPPSQ